MKVKFKIVKYTDRDVLCPYKIVFKEDKWYKPWYFLLTESVGGDAVHFVVANVERYNELVESIDNPFTHNEKVLNNVERKKLKIEIIKEYN